MAFMGIIGKYFLAGFIGFLIGVVLSCFLLAKKNLDKAHAIEDNIEASFKSAKKNYKSMTRKNERTYSEYTFTVSELEDFQKQYKKSE
ncbi:MAG: hypothetical protein K2J39_03765 [Ruminococcus sp.]|nr:hypothetical protein [Ruminococcus sp.]